MNLKDRLSLTTASAIDADNKRKSHEAAVKKEQEEQKLKATRANADAIIAGIETKAMKAAEHKQRKVVIVETDLPYDVSHNQDVRVTKNNIEDYYYKVGLFNKNIRDYFIASYIVNELDMDVVFEFQHDGVGIKSWYVLVMCW